MSRHESRELPVSVVIATLGGPTLMRTIDCLNESGPRPAEIIVCVPDEEWGNRSDCIAPNVAVHRLPFRGQVRQRAAGFLAATSPYVLQLDDDLLLTGRALESLLQALLGLAPLSVVAPVFVRSGSGVGFARVRKGTMGLLASITATLLRGAAWSDRRMGTISRVGHNYGVNPNEMTEKLMVVEWLPGGCILHRRENLIFEDFYPYAGKAYAEDLLHSFLLSEKGIRFWVVKGAQCQIEVDALPRQLSDALRESRARRYVARVRGIGSLNRLILTGGDVASFLGSRIWASFRTLAGTP